MKEATVRIKGVTPCLMHNGQMTDPLNRFTKAMKELTGKRKKTDADQEAMARLELEAAYYIDDQGRPCWPGENIESGFCAAAAKLRLKTTAKSAFFCSGMWPIIHNGPKHYLKLMDDPAYVDYRTVRNPGSNGRVMRTRPIFNDWALEFKFWFSEDTLNTVDVRQVFDIFGEQIGLSDYRPKYGRFIVEKFDVT